MNQRKFFAVVDRFAAPVVMTACGLVLLFSPDTASALISLILRWILTLWAIGCAVMGVLSDRDRVRHLLMAAVLVIFCRWLRGDPLALAAALGRILGFSLLMGGGWSLFKARSGSGRVISLGECLLGLILLFLPMTTSRLVFGALGFLLTAAGVGMLLSRLRNAKKLNGWDDPNIIDAL